MYDSDEVRDAVLRDAADLHIGCSLMLRFGEPVAPLSLLDEAVIDDACTAKGNLWQRMLREHLEEFGRDRHD